MEATWVRERRERNLQRVLLMTGLSDEQKATIRRMETQWALKGQTLATRESKVRWATQFGASLAKPFEAATREDLEAYLTKIAARCKSTTVKQWKIFLKSFYKDVLAPEDREHPKLVSWIRAPRTPASTKLPEDLLTPEEIRKLASSATHPRDRAVIMVLAESGARISELVSSRVGDANFDQYGARIRLRGKTGERIVRLIHAVPDLRTWLNHHPFRNDPNAPMFLSWQRQNQYGPLMHDGVYDILQHALKLSGIRKRVHPHLFRHTRFTELARHLKPAELEIVAGWTPGSSMSRVYVHLSGDDVDRRMLESAGLLPKNEVDKPNPLATRACARCGTTNGATTEYCTTCTFPMDETRRAAQAKEEEALRAKIPKLLQLIEDPEIARLLARKVNEGSLALSKRPPRPQ